MWPMSGVDFMVGLRFCVFDQEEGDAWRHQLGEFQTLRSAGLAAGGLQVFSPSEPS